MKKMEQITERVSVEDENYIFYQALVQAQFKNAAIEGYLLYYSSVLLMCFVPSVVAKFVFALVLFFVIMDVRQDRKIIKKLRDCIEQNKEINNNASSYWLLSAYILFGFGLLVSFVK